MDKLDDQENIRRIRFLELTEKKRRDMEQLKQSKQLEMELGNFKVLQAIRKSKEERNKEARKSFFRFVKFNFRRMNGNDSN